MDPEDFYDLYLWDEKTGAPMGVRPPRADDRDYYDPSFGVKDPDSDTFGDTSRYFLDRSRRDMADELRALSQAEGWGERLLRGVNIPLIGIEGLGAQGLALLSEMWPHSLTHSHMSPDQAEREFVETWLYEVPEATAGRVATQLPRAIAQGEHRLRRAAGDFTDQYPSDELGFFHSAYAPTRAHMEQMAQPGYQFNPAEISYMNRVNEANRLRDEGLTNREIFEQTRIMLVPQRDAAGNIVEEVALTATPRPHAYPTQVAPDARSRALGAELRGSEEEVRDLIDFGPDVEGLYPGGGPRADVRFERFSDPGVGGEHRAGTIYVSNRSRHLDRFIPIIAHEGEHDVQDLSGLLPDARGTSDDFLPGNPAERFAAYEANLGEMLARRAEGDDTTSVAAGIMQALNPFLRESVHLPDLMRGELLPRFTVRVPANIFEANRNVGLKPRTLDPWDMVGLEP